MAKYTSKETLQRRQKQRRARRLALASLGVISIFIISFGITSFINLFDKEEEEIDYFISPETSAVPTQEEITQNLELFPAIQLEPQTILSSNSINLAVVENGRVHLEYFSDSLILGDSLADGFREYQTTTGIDNAIFFTNRSLMPSSFLNGNYVEIPGYDAPIDALSEIRNLTPKKIYVILGTNAMFLSDEEFLATYTSLIDELILAAPDSYIYINSLLPVTSEKSASDTIYSPDRVISLNNALAKIASQKSVHFLNVYEIFAVEGGHLNIDLAYSDGIHLTPTGYKMWTDYLISHTVYNEHSPFVVGSPYIKP